MEFEMNQAKRTYLKVIVETSYLREFEKDQQSQSLNNYLQSLVDELKAKISGSSLLTLIEESSSESSSFK